MKWIEVTLKGSFIVCFSLCFLLQKINAQELLYRQGELLVELEKGDSGDALVRHIKSQYGQDQQFDLETVVNEPIYILKLKFDFTIINELELKREVQSFQGTRNVQFNHLIKNRAIPDDPLFSDQWQYINMGTTGGVEGVDLDADIAWDITTGGITASGDTIVACIIDDGIDPTHADFGDNLWINHAEIPGNGIDDDNNGYVDDYNGWNTYDENDDIHQDGSHGTPVAGITGAKGNNGIGVSGVNWDIKLMITVGGGDEALALAAYAYPYIMRKKYNETDGAEGAFVVVTNASWGTDMGQAEDAPIWCNFYDSLGTVGILSVGATTNGNTNVDEMGDLPTTCPSNYLIAVSNINDSGMKVASAGYGVENIDLGAFGEDTYTTALNNNYGPFSGTSGAAPHVTGAVALAYALPCDALSTLTKADPATAALRVREAILEGTLKDDSYSNLFATGGRLNMALALENLLDVCTDCPLPLNVEVADIYLDSATVSWESPGDVMGFNFIFKEESDADWDTLLDVESPVILKDLLFCTEYEVRVQTICAEDSLGNYSFPTSFQTLGCCDAPSGLEFANGIDSIASGNILLSWENHPDYENYFVEITDPDTEESIEIETDETMFLVNGVGFCELIDVRLRALCITGDTTEYSDIFTAVSSCGDCTDLDFCEVPELTTVDEFIQSITIGLDTFVSGDNQGYMDFSGFSNFRITEVDQPFQLIKGYNNSAFSEYVKVWIDINRDGVFAESEMIYDEGNPSMENIDTTIRIDQDFEEGFARMRVAMTFIDPPTICKESSETIFGEYEDHCVYLTYEYPCDTGIEILEIVPMETGADITFSAVDTSIAYNVRYKEVIQGEEDWTTISVLDTMTSLAPLEECTEYVVQVRAVCEIDTSGFVGVTDTFTTLGVDCMVNVDDLFSYNEVILQAFPNPFSDQFQVELNSYKAYEANMAVFNSAGKLMTNSTIRIPEGESSVRIEETASWPPGIYYLRLSGTDLNQSIKLIKIR